MTMKPLAYGCCLVVALMMTGGSQKAAAADAEAPAKPVEYALTIDLEEGSRILGISGDKGFKFHSDILGDIDLPLDHVRAVEVPAKGEAVKLTTSSGDELKVQFAMKTISVETAFGNFTLPVELIRKVWVSSSQHPETAHAGLVGFWNGESNDVILSGGATRMATAFGQAFSFDGVSGSAKIPPSPSQNVGEQVTMEFWMKADPSNRMDSYQGLVGTDYYFIEISTGATGGARMGIEFGVGTANGQNSFNGSSRSRNFTGASAETANVNGGGEPVSAGEWHHVAGTYDGSKVQLYLDGKPSGNSAPFTGTIAPMAPGSYISMGSEEGMTSRQAAVAGRYFKGLIDNVAIYNRALTAEEIQADYNAGAKNKN